jgi:ABC-type bacteriocin/lantibiotic exporter with double-glycine peptidase domain
MIERSRTTNQAQELRVEHVFQLNMGIYKFKFTLNFVMNILTALGTAVILGLGGYYVIVGQTEIGTVVAFVSGLSKITSPWGDLVNWYRDFRVTQERYRLVVVSLGMEQSADPEPATT